MWEKIRSLGLGTRIVALTAITLVVVVAVNYAVFIHEYRDGAVEALVHKADAFTAVADETKNHVGRLHQGGAFDTKMLLEDLKTTLAANEGVEDAKIFGTIPVVAGWTAAEEAAKIEDIEFRIAAFDARNKKHEPAPGSFDESLLRDLSGSYAKGQDIVYRIDDSTNELHYMRGIRLGEECMMCHGNPGNQWDTDGDGLDPVGFRMEGWKSGDMHGAYHVVMPLAPVDAAVAGFIKAGLIWTLPLAIAVLFGFVIALRVMFGRPIRLLIDSLKDIAEGEGDLTRRIDVKSADEIGQLGTNFNRFVGKIHDVIVEISGVSRDVASAATEIAASSEEMASGLSNQNSQVVEISSAIEEMSANSGEVAKKSGDAANQAANSGSVAEEGGRLVLQTIDDMKRISESVSASATSVAELGRRGEQIGQITKVINDIADQTNLLALNAAIEAARAGEHGRGFAVVADEVRVLADRTTKATEEIAESIATIQRETAEAVRRMEEGREKMEAGVVGATHAGDALRKIVGSTHEVQSLIHGIAAAAAQQSVAAAQVSRNVEGVTAVTRESNEGANQAAVAASQLSHKAEQLRSLVDRFKTQDSAGHHSGMQGVPGYGGPPDYGNSTGYDDYRRAA